MKIEGLRSCYDKVGGIVYLGRMLDKIRLHQAGRLPADFHDNLGIGFDGRCAAFLGVAYDEIKARTLSGGSDEEILAWCQSKGGIRNPTEILFFNDFMIKRGWRDGGTAGLEARKKSSGMADRTDLLTFFDQIEVDEDRTPPRPPHS